MRIYNIRIEAELDGKKIEFTEVVAFPLQDERRHGSVCECDRESGAIKQVEVKYPQLKNVRAVSSYHVLEGDSGREKYIPLPQSF